MLDRFILGFGWMAILGCILAVIASFQSLVKARRHKWRAGIGLAAMLLMTLVLIGVGIANFFYPGSLQSINRLIFPMALLVIAILLWTSPALEWEIDRIVLVILTFLGVIGLIGLSVLALFRI